MKSRFKEKIIQKADVEKAVQAEWDSKVDQVYEDVRRDVVVQILAVILCYLNKRYGWKAKVLNSVKEGAEDLLKMMQKDGIMGKPFTTENCIEYLKGIGVNIE